MAGGISGAGPRGIFRSLGISATGLSAQRLRIEAIAMNIANAETTRTADGTPYRRKVVTLQEAPFAPILRPMIATDLPAGAWLPAPGGRIAAGDADGLGGVRVVGVEEDLRDGPLEYDPGHPDANEDGYVRMPNVSITDEMVTLMEARRLYEANASVFEAVKSMLRQAARL